MGILAIVALLLGLAAAGVLVDVVVENGSGPAHGVAVFGQTMHLSIRELAVAGAILGAAVVILVAVGLALLARRRGRRRAQGTGWQPDRQELERRVEQLAARSRLLESQNASLNQENLALRQRAEELEPATERSPEFGPAGSQVSKTALISAPPPPVPPGGGEPVGQRRR
ncbi:MAG: hypothetical protein M3Q23_02225 [Actinomycetota bacterium]|nr:hypothetical protein [Actinomycetota bacterium]